MSDPNARELVQTEFAALTAPLRTLVEGLDAQIVETREKLDDLVTARHDAAKMLRIADPEFEPRDKPGPKQTANGNGGYVPTDKKVAEIAEWLIARRDELGEFTAADVLANNQKPPGSHEALRKAMTILHERGVLVLQRSGRGGSKIYRVA